MSVGVGSPCGGRDPYGNEARMGTPVSTLFSVTKEMVPSNLAPLVPPLTKCSAEMGWLIPIFLALAPPGHTKD